MYQQDSRELEGIANLLATKGRYGDSMMVHMNPIEVQGLASMSPTGSLTINPDTGQPEAFLPFLAPLLGGMLGSAAVGAGGILSGLGLSSAVGGAIGSGLTTAIVEGDLKKGLLSGITGFGVGQALGKLGSAGVEGVETALNVPADKITGISDLVPKIPDANFIDSLAPEVSGATSQSVAEGISLGRGINDPLVKGFVEQAPKNIPTLTGGSSGPSMSQVFSGEGLKALTSPTALVATAVGEGTNEQLRVDEAMEDMAKDSLRKKEQDYESAVARRDANYFPGYQKPYGDSYTQYASSGGIVSLDPSDFKRRMNELQQLGVPVKKMDVGGFVPNIDIGRLIQQPSEDQGGLRGAFSISPEQLESTYQKQGLPGFGPEIMYFSEEKGKDVNPYEGWMAEEYGFNRAGEPLTKKDFDYIVSQGGSDANKDGIIDAEELAAYHKAQDEKKATKATGGNAPVTLTPEQMKSFMNYGQDYSKYFRYAEGGGIQNLADKEESTQDTDRLIELASMAVLGTLPEEESEVVIQAFIDEFGSEAFQMLRDQVLEGVVPGSQKEGEIVGSGGGMDDEIMGMIGNQQPVAVSPGEYIVPADVVSGLGDGSTDAGVQELDGMLDRVRVERTNTTQQPAPLRKGGVLPR